jgi:hypothetical protein
MAARHPEGIDMPIQVQQTGTIADVEREIRDFEKEYKMSSDEFLTHPNLEEVISEFDSMEWHFLLMQKRALREDQCSPRVFKGQTVTKVDAKEPVDLYDIAA